MNSSSLGSGPQSTPDFLGGRLPSLFPFFVLFNRDLRLIGFGPSLQKACPEIHPGPLLAEFFLVERPRILLSKDTLEMAPGSLYVLKHTRSSLRIRGQMVSLPDSEAFLFLGSPWVRSPEELREWNLSLDDFAVHDATPELMQASVSQRLAIDDLRRITAKLEQQRSELRAALETNRAGEHQRRLLSLIVSRSSNAVIVRDSAGRIEWVNDSFTRLTGYSLDEVLGTRPGELLEGPRTDQAIIAEMHRALLAGEGFKCTLANYRKDGSLFWNRLEVQSIRSASGEFSKVVSWLSDVTAERDTAARNELMLRVTRLLAEASDGQQATQEILKLICEAVGASYAGLWWDDGQGKVLRLAQFWSVQGIAESEFLSRSRALCFSPGQGLPGLAWQRNAVVPLPQVEEASGWYRKEAAVRAGLRSGIAFPVRTSGKTLGVIEIFAACDDLLPGFLLPIVESLGVKIGQFIERRSVETERDRILSLLQSALDSAPEGIVISDVENRAVKFNKRWSEIVGGQSAAAQPRWSDTLIHQFRRPHQQLPEWVLLESQRTQSLTANFELVDGRTIEVITNPHRHEGEIIGQIWLFRDVTGSLAASKDRERLVATLNSTLESTNDGILVTGLKRERIVFNQRFLEMWRIPRAVAEEKRDSSLVPYVLDQLLEPERFDQRLQSLEEDSTAIATDLFELTDGRVFELYTQPQRIGDRIIGRVWCYRDVSSQRAALRSVEDSEQRYRFIAETAPDAIVTFDRGGSIRFANRNAIARFVGSDHDLSGVQVSNFFPESSRRRYTRLLRRFIFAKSDSELPPMELQLVDASSHLFPAEVKLGISSQAGEPLVTAVVRDISQRKAIEEQARQAARSAAAANRAKSDFLANISHEIRTPLNAIVGLTELLRGSSLSGETREAVDSIWVSAESLLALINDLLDISKIEAGQIDLQYQDFDPAELAERAVDVIRVRASAKSLRVYFYAEPSTPPMLRGDPNRIRQVLVNLLSNAVKFTENGAITLKLRWDVASAGVALQYVVEDSGIGIAPDEQDRIFDNFYRTDSPLTAQNGGAGLGLGISRAIATRLGGTLTVNSTLGEGSTFTFSLPEAPLAGGIPVAAESQGTVLVATMEARMELQMAVVRSAGFIPLPCARSSRWPKDTSNFTAILIDEEWAEAENCSPASGDPVLWLRMTGRAADPDHRPVLLSPLTPSRLRRSIASLAPAKLVPRQLPVRDWDTEGRRILLVEDSPAGQLYFRKLLASQGYTITVAASAAEAYAAACNIPFDLILMDIQLPDGSGVDVIRELRAFETSASRAPVPIIALSAHALADFRESALAAGADDYITKPVRAATLLQGIRQRFVRQATVLVLAQSPLILSSILALAPAATGAVLNPDGTFQLPAGKGPFDVVILAANAPSVSFVAAALKAVSGFPRERLLLLGDRWPRDCVNLAGGAEALPLPGSALSLDRLVRVTASVASPPLDTVQSSTLAEEIAALGFGYLRGLLDSLPDARAQLLGGDLSALARFAHRVKGSGSAYGFPVLTLLASELEEAVRSNDHSAAAKALDTLADEVSQALVRTKAV